MKRQFLGRLLSLFLVGTVVAGVGCKDYDDDITSLNNRIDELTTGQIASVEKQMQSLQNAVDRLDGVDSGLKDEIEALQGKAETQAGEIGKLQEELGKAASASEVEALKKQIETLESDKGKLEKRIEALESARTSLQDEIDAVKGSLANYLTKSDAEATYATKTTVESLSQLLNQIKANYVSAEGLASTLEGYVTDAELADYPTLTVLQEAIRQSETAMKNSLGEAMKPILAKYNFVQKDVLDLEIQDLQEQIDALSGKPDADGSLANIKSRLEALENAEIKYDESNAAFTKGVEDCIGKALANDGAIDQAIANAIKDVAGEYEGTMQDLKNLIDGLRMDVDQLLSRIQSLVYVPAYDDHKASVNALYYAPEGEEPVLLANGTVEMTFRVTPVEAAGQLVAAYAAEPEMFSLEMEQVKTRATVPALNIQKVEADETGNGRFIVTALPADFTPDFFTGKVSYSIALRVQKAYDAEAGNDYSANVVSDYVNLVPARADVKAVVLAPAKEDGSIDGIVIGNAFTAVNDYTSYEVNKFDPIRSFTQSETVEIPTRTAEATYTKNICEVLSLRDMRDADDMKGFELIDHDATLADPWITGDDTNGFATGVRPNSDKVFGLEAIRIVSFSVTYADNGFDASAALGDRVTVDETTGQITFSNLNNLSLQKDVDVTVNVEVAYPWAVKSGKVTYKILK